MRTSGLSGVPKPLLLEGNGQLSCKPPQKKIKKMGAPSNLFQALSHKIRPIALLLTNKGYVTHRSSEDSWQRTSLVEVCCN